MKQFFLVTLSVLFLLGCTKEDEFLVDSFRDCDQPKRAVDELTSELLGLTVEDTNSQVLETGQWEVLDDEAGASINVTVTEGSSQYLPGIIGICKNQLFADQIYVNLLGFLYVKLD